MPEFVDVIKAKAIRLSIPETKEFIKTAYRKLYTEYMKYKLQGKEDKFDPHRVVKPILLVGNPGIGKSSIVRQAAYELTQEFNQKDGTVVHVIDIRLSQFDPTDLKGLPRFADNAVEWILPKFLPRAGFGLLFFDEINLAPESVLKAAYQLVLDRKIGEEYELPKGWMILAAMNPPEIAKVAVPIPPPLINRFTIIYTDITFEDWLPYALDAGIHPEVIAYLKLKPSKLLDITPGFRGEQFPSPRTWEYVSTYLKMGLSEDQLKAAICGCVGEATGLDFITFRRIRYASPVPIDEAVKGILTGRYPDLSPLLTEEEIELELKEREKVLHKARFPKFTVVYFILISALEGIGRYPEISLDDALINYTKYLVYLLCQVKFMGKISPRVLPPDLIVSLMILLIKNEYLWGRLNQISPELGIFLTYVTQPEMIETLPEEERKNIIENTCKAVVQEVESRITRRFR